MKKLIITILIILSINLNTLIASAETFDITSKNMIIYNLNDQKELYSNNKDEKVQIASLTKIMTILVALENIKDLDEEITIDSKVFNGISEYAQAGLEIGDKVTYRDLLYGAMLPSGADAVNAIVQNVTTTKEKYIDLMNKKAKELNLNNTFFDNAIGRDSKNNYSTAQDIATLLLYALENKEFKTIFTTKTYTIKSNHLKMNSTLSHYAGKLDVSNITGAKSGFTDGAGVCLASIATVNDINYLQIMLGSDASNRSNAVKDSLIVYKYYGDNYSYQNVITKNQKFDKLKVKWGKKKSYQLKSNKDIKLYLKNGTNLKDIKYTYKGIKEITYKNKKGDKLGTITATFNDVTLTTYDVYLTEDLKYYHPILYSIIIISFTVMLVSLICIKKQHSKKKKTNKKRNSLKRKNPKRSHT